VAAVATAVMGGSDVVREPIAWAVTAAVVRDIVGLLSAGDARCALTVSTNGHREIDMVVRKIASCGQ